ncbi:MAG: GPP34 family phosphoprotein [Oscillospiraceae bacterium]|jgi:hypothetical protein|nr:GPP34 family phosphoprotein [Oscillospiraceae bacterium]
MKDLSIIQEYTICAVNEKGKFPALSTEKAVCFVTAGILELRLEKCISIDGKKLDITGELPANRQYLKPLYNVIAQKAPVRLERVIEAYNYCLTHKHSDQLMESVGISLMQLGLAKEGRTGLLGSKKSFIPTQEAVRSVVEMLRAELLEDGEITEEAATLVILLEKGKCLKPYFSQFEQKEIKKKLRELIDSPEGKLVKDMVSYIECLIAASASSAASV